MISNIRLRWYIAKMKNNMKKKLMISITIQLIVGVIGYMYGVFTYNGYLLSETVISGIVHSFKAQMWVVLFTFGYIAYSSVGE